MDIEQSDDCEMEFRSNKCVNAFSASENVGRFRSRVWSQSPARKKGKVVVGDDIVEDIL